MANKDYIIDRIIIDIRNGQSIPSIALANNISRSALNKLLSSHPEYEEIKNTTKIGIDEVPNICQLYQHGWSMQEIANEYNVCIQTINKLLIKNKIGKRKVGRNPDFLFARDNKFGYRYKARWEKLDDELDFHI